jgi:STE24 endopeptidase
VAALAPSAGWAAPDRIEPEALKYFTPEDVARGHAYTTGRYWLFAAGTALRLGFLALLVLSPASAALRNLAVRCVPSRPAVAVAIYLLLLVLLSQLLTLPLGYYAGFVREHAFGLSTQSAPAWFLDRLKAALLELALAVPSGCVLVLLWRRYPGRWVLPAWLLGAVLMFVLVALAPVVIDPLFNTTRPVQDAGLRQRVLALAQRAGLPTEGVYETDASQRTRKANAYFTGLFATKRIVLYDTLIAQNDPEAVDLVVAHEMGHWKHAHIWKGIGLSLLALAILLWCGAWVVGWAGRNHLFHLGGPADVAAVPLFLLTLFLLSLLSLPLQNAVSRGFEREADSTSLELTRNPQAFIRAEVSLARSNLSDLAPPHPIVWLLYTHPPTLERIRMAEEFARTLPPR